MPARSEQHSKNIDSYKKGAADFKKPVVMTFLGYVLFRYLAVVRRSTTVSWSSTYSWVSLVFIDSLLRKWKWKYVVGCHKWTMHKDCCVQFYFLHYWRPQRNGFGIREFCRKFWCFSQFLKFFLYRGLKVASARSLDRWKRISGQSISILAIKKNSQLLSTILIWRGKGFSQILFLAILQRSSVG